MRASLGGGRGCRPKIVCTGFETTNEHHRPRSFADVVSLLLLALLTLLLLLARTLTLLRTRRVVAPTTPRCARHAVEWRAWGGGVRDGHVRVGVEGHELGLGRLERGAEGGVLDAELIDDRAALLPPPVRLVGGRERGVEQLRARFERLDVPAGGRGRDAGEDGVWDGRERKNARR